MSAAVLADPSRTCGTCNACCVHLGIDELQKPRGTPCKHLCRAGTTKQCGIYEQRPATCAAFACMWRMGFGPSQLKPSLSGLLITPQPADESGEPNHAGPFMRVFVSVIDRKNAKRYRRNVIQQLLNETAVRAIVEIIDGEDEGRLYRGGKVYRFAIGERPPWARSFENLYWLVDPDPIASYYLCGADDAPPEGGARALV